MKKVSLMLFVMILGISFNGFSQTTAPTEFFAGKWEVNILGTPNGNAKFVTNLIRKDGKLTGELADSADTTKAKVPITKIEEMGDNIAIYFFTTEAGEIAIELSKVDTYNLKGHLMNMFEANARRLKE